MKLVDAPNAVDTLLRVVARPQARGVRKSSRPMSKHSKETERLQKIVESFPNVTITVVGDLVADEFIFGEISRVSREAPVLILRHRERTVSPGRRRQRRQQPRRSGRERAAGRSGGR